MMVAEAYDLAGAVAMIVKAGRMRPAGLSYPPTETRITADGVEFYELAKEGSEELDPDGREGVIGVGISAHRAGILLSGNGLEHRFSVRRDPRRPGLVARLSILGVGGIAERDRRLYRALSADPPAVPAKHGVGEMASALEELGDAAAEEGVQLRWVGEGLLREQAGSMLEAGDRMRFARKRECQELRAWFGLESESGHPQEPASSWVWTVTPGETGTLRKSRRQIEAASGELAVICTPYDDGQNWLKAGMARSKTGLLAATLGLQLTDFNQPLRIPGFRALFARESGFCSFPQAIVRIQQREVRAAISEDVQFSSRN